jgi:2,5-diamino-6-(ribosylamino)-4(3H)-pyrimidinone 5'-phosphate reductase
VYNEGMKNYFLILHSAISLNGKIEGFDINLEKYYALVGIWDEDITLSSSQTIVDAGDTEDKEEPNSINPAAGNQAKPILAVVDSKGLVRCWNTLRKSGYWRDFLALVSEQTPKSHLKYLEKRNIKYLVIGRDQVDIVAALNKLNEEYGRITIRVDAGSTLNALLLEEDLVDEISLLIHPEIAPGDKRDFLNESLISTNHSFRLLSSETHEDGLIWVRYHKIS